MINIKQAVISLSIATMVISFTGCTSNQPDNNSETKPETSVSTKPIEEDNNETTDNPSEQKDGPVKYITESGSVRIGKSGAMRVEGRSSAPVTVDFFFDPACPASAKYNRSVGKDMKQMVESGDIELVIRPVPYLNEETADDYSNRASAYILAVAEYAPTKVLDFTQTILTLEFQPNASATDKTDDVKFIEAMEMAGLNKSEIDRVDYNKESFVSTAIVAGNDFFDVNSEWLKRSNSIRDDKPFLFTPFVLINKSGENSAKSLIIEGESRLEEQFVEQVNKIKTSVDKENESKVDKDK